LTPLSAFSSLTELNLCGDPVLDHCFENLYALDLEKDLDSLRGLETLTALKTLGLSGIQVLDADAIAGLTNLTTLDLSETNLGEHGLATLANFTALSSLDLTYTSLINDEDLGSLTTLPSPFSTYLSTRSITYPTMV
jgi:Leucine-rich repeat (LRR) protein